jgi:putative flippase GtrA
MMSSKLGETLSTLRTRGLKFATVSIGTTVLSQILLFVLSKVLAGSVGLSTDTAWTVANVTAVSVSAVPSFYLNRMWVWERGRKNIDFKREVVPFWGFAIAGLILSTITVAIAAQLTDVTIVANIANLIAFTTLWIVKLVVLDKRVFIDSQTEPSAQQQP